MFHFIGVNSICKAKNVSLDMCTRRILLILHINLHLGDLGPVKTQNCRWPAKALTRISVCTGWISKWWLCARMWRYMFLCHCPVKNIWNVPNDMCTLERLCLMAIDAVWSEPSLAIYGKYEDQTVHAGVGGGGRRHSRMTKGDICSGNMRLQ